MTINLLLDKTILVTGASSGIGRAVAQYFSTQGAKLVITGRNQDRLNQTLDSLSGKSHNAISANLCSESDIQRFMDQVFNIAGPLDALVHSAGIQKTLPLQALREHHFDEIFSVNVKSAQFLAKNFRKKGRHNSSSSSLIFISSVAASCGGAAISTYSASKAALQGLSKSLSIELARNSIRVNCIAPGYVQTEMAIEFAKQLNEEQMSKIVNKHPLGLGRPEDVAYAAGFLSSDLSKWITGTTLFVDGGYSAQ